ncbi:hypothetical protein Bbelb_087390 [Branchiostoma belcheri]|nr:hypothetical protein Bbelb_087390 [Branchiostoma belcheri]
MGRYQALSGPNSGWSRSRWPESKSPAETLKTGKGSSTSPKALVEKFRVRPGMDGREQETMEEDEESGSEDSGSEWSSWKKKEALRTAAGAGDTDRVKQLLAEGVNPNAVGGFRQWTPLHRAARNGHHETVSVLLTAGADVNTRDDIQDSPLHWAACNVAWFTPGKIILSGVKTPRRHFGLPTGTVMLLPLRAAAPVGCGRLRRAAATGTVSVLLTAGADVNAQNMVVAYALSDKIAPKLRQIPETAGAAKPHGIGSPHRAASWRRGNFDGRKPAKFAAKISKMKGPHKYYLYGALPGTVYLVLDTR